MFIPKADRERNLKELDEKIIGMLEGMRQMVIDGRYGDCINTEAYFLEMLVRRRGTMMEQRAAGWPSYFRGTEER